MSKIQSLLLAGLLVSASAFADSNVALNKPVTLNGGGWNQGGWGGGILAPASSVNDGLFKPEGHQWDIETVWWDGTLNTGAEIVIDLGSANSIASFVIQADNNDTYRVEYQVGGGSWTTAWSVPLALNGGGLSTRNVTLDAPILADTLRITAINGDNWYSVSEFQAFTQAVPEPETYALLLAGLGLTLIAARRKRAG